MEEISKYYKDEVDRLTGKDFMLESLSRHCASSLNIIDSLSEKELAGNNSAEEIKILLTNTANHINKLKQQRK